MHYIFSSIDGYGLYPPCSKTVTPQHISFRASKSFPLTNYLSFNKETFIPPALLAWSHPSAWLNNVHAF